MMPENALATPDRRVDRAMNASDPAVVIGETALDAADVFRHLRRRGRLATVLRAAAIERHLHREAKRAGLGVSAAELQAGADDFRARRGLHGAAETLRWLDGQRMSLDDFESRLEHDLLLQKLRDHVCRDRLAAHFADHRDSYARVSLRQIV